MRPNRRCCVPGCNGGYDKPKKENKLLGLRNRSLFKAKNEAQLQKWRRVIPRLDRVISERDVVCEVHFPEDVVIRYFETRMPDGSINRIPRERPSLKPDAYPVYFPNCPSYMSRKIKLRKAPKVRHSIEPPNPAEHSSPDEGPEFDTHGEENLLALLADVAGKETPLPVPEEVEIVEVDDVPVFNISTVIDGISGINLPGRNWTTAIVGCNVVFLCVGNDFKCVKTVAVTENLEIKVIFHGRDVTVSGLKTLTNLEDVSQVIHIINGLRVCADLAAQNSERERVPAKCQGYVPKKTPRNRGRGPSVWCASCRLTRKLQADRTRRRQESGKTIRDKAKKNALKICRIRATRLQGKVDVLKVKLETMRKEWARKSEQALNEQISTLTSCQQEAVKACFTAAKARSPKGVRYTRDWVYECLLLRIKSRRAYEHIRSHGILTLPSMTTLRRYLENVKGTYGFQEATFQCLKQKAGELPMEDRRGTLLVDEMKLSKCLSFDKQSLKICGFTNLGDHTPLHQKNQRGDHALVMMFQPFRGRWVQALACFLSKGCASSTVLHHLIMECIILMEKAGFFVDLVTTDGAQWNRSMWKHFGIDEDRISCGHPFNPSRRLWFASDFPHLVKNMRNFFVSREENWTPDGVLKLRHWETVVKLDNSCSFQLKACPKLSMDHIHPKPYQKMNVARAFQFFGCNVAAAMKLFKSRHEDLEDCGPSTVFIERVARVIRAMNSRTPARALIRDSEGWESIKQFITYLQQWKAVASRRDYFFLSSNTAMGFHVTLKAALELYEFLEAECGFKYLMTARLNQDALERFFGMMRSACGSNDHPDPIVFKQMFKLISCYSLIKPPKGSNVSGGDLLATLMSVKDIHNPRSRDEKLQSILDVIIDKGNLADDIPVLLSVTNDHDYFPNVTTDFVLSFFCGYVARKASRFTKCESCKLSLHRTPGQEVHDFLTNERNEGNLTYGSARLFSLMKVLEDRTVKVLSSTILRDDTILDIIAAFEDVDSLPLIGCGEHCWTFTEAIVRFFFVTRIHFACSVANKADNIQQEKARLHRKSAKLQ